MAPVAPPISAPAAAPPARPVTRPPVAPPRMRRAATASLAAIALAPRVVFGQAAPPPPTGPFKLDPLPYANTALEPHIDAQTMMIHHDRHHAAYVNNLNNFAKDNPKIAQAPIQDVLAKLSEV